jgi:hypothetical protein
MRISLFTLLSVLIISCSEPAEISNEGIVVEETTVTTIPDTVIVLEEETTPYYPSFTVEDSSWSVALDIQEGFLLNFTIFYKDGKKLFKDVDNEVPSSGGVDHPQPHFINDTTYIIPNVGSSPLGYYEMLIYKDGTYHFNQIVLVDTTKNN